jgi:hypothetical protein
MMLAIFRNGRIYEGDGFSLNALYPMPSLAHVVLDPRTQTLPEFLGSLPSMVSPLFREDSGSASLSVLIGLIGLLGDKRACERTWIGLPGRTCGFLGSSETAIVG